MKKLVTLIMASAMILGVTSSCVDHNFEAPISYQQKVEEAFDAAFIKEFGHVHPDQDWGFGESTETKAALTRGVNANANQWFTGEGGATPVYEVDLNVTTTERNGVFNYVNKNINLIKTSKQPNWTDYFVTQVWKGNLNVAPDGSKTPKSTSYPNQNGQTTTIDGAAHMDQLETKLADGAWEHIYNFNNGQNGNTVDDVNGNHIVEKMLMVGSGTTSFRYNNSQGSFQSEKYIVVSGTDIFGADSEYAKYYYVCFDFEKGYTDEEKAGEVTNTTISGSYEKLTGKTEGTPATTSEGIFSYDGAVYGTYYASADSISVDPVAYLMINTYVWDSWNYAKGTYVSAVKDVVVTITESLNSENNKYTKWTVNGTYVLTIPGTEGSETWETVTFNNENFNPNGYYTAEELTAAKVLELKGVTAQVRNVNISVNLKGYQYGDKHFKGDNNYTDWIVRISPAKVKGDPGTQTEDTIPSYTVKTIRVYAEDLYTAAEQIESMGSTKSDYDYNDVVFDIVTTRTAAGALVSSKVIVQAAGGTLPLYLTYNSTPVEVHEALLGLGASHNIMVNTGRGTTTAPATVFSSTTTEIQARDIIITCDHPNQSGVPILAKKGEPASKFAVDMSNVTFTRGYQGKNWSNECTHITRIFPGFADWVAESGDLFEYENPAGN